METREVIAVPVSYGKGFIVKDVEIVLLTESADIYNLMIWSVKS